MSPLFDFNNAILPAGGCVAIGNFDGVHLGHQQMLSELLVLANEKKTTSTVLTFHPHPIELLRPQQIPPRLCTLSQKAKLLQEYGVDDVIAFPIDMNFLQKTPQQFFDEIILQQLQATGMVEGENFYFGRDRSGDIATLQEFCKQADVELRIIHSIQYDGETVSSTRIRKAIANGEMQQAVKLLGHPYEISGQVVSGEKRGRQLGFPTANLSEIKTLIPAEGVYAGVVNLNDHCFAAAIHIGTNPTFQDDQQKFEVHLLNFDGDLYNQELTVRLLQQIRPVNLFHSQEELQNQLKIDMKQVIKVVEQYKDC